MDESRKIVKVDESDFIFALRCHGCGVVRFKGTMESTSSFLDRAYLRGWRKILWTRGEEVDKFIECPLCWRKYVGEDYKPIADDERDETVVEDES